MTGYRRDDYAATEANWIDDGARGDLDRDFYPPARDLIEEREDREDLRREVVRRLDGAG